MKEAAEAEAEELSVRGRLAWACRVSAVRGWQRNAYGLRGVRHAALAGRVGRGCCEVREVLVDFLWSLCRAVCHLGSAYGH